MVVSYNAGVMSAAMLIAFILPACRQPAAAQPCFNVDAGGCRWAPLDGWTCFIAMGPWRPRGARPHITARSLQAGTSSEWLVLFTRWYESLDAIHKSLSRHLETKQLGLPTVATKNWWEMLVFWRIVPPVWQQVGACIALRSVPLSNL